MVNNLSLARKIYTLWQYFPLNRKKQFFFVLILMLMTALAEIISIGAIIPFIYLISGNDQAISQSFIRGIGGVVYSQLYNSYNYLFYVASLFSLAIILATILRLVLLRFTVKLSFGVGADISAQMYRRTLYRPYQIQISTNTSEVIASVTGKSNAVIYGTVLPVLNIFSGLLIIAAISFALFYINPLVMAIVFTCFIFIYLVIFLIARKNLRQGGENISQESTRIVKILQEGLGGIRDILLDGTQEIFYGLYKRADKRLRDAQAVEVFVGQSPRYLVEMIGTLVLILVATITANHNMDDSISTVAFVAVIALGAQRLLPVMQQVFVSLASIQSNAASLTDILNLLDKKNSIHTNLPVNQMVFNNDIQFVGVSFAYDKQCGNTLSEVNFSIRKGDKVGVVGKTGSGKSTLIDILLGLLTPTSGHILIDGVRLGLDNCKNWQLRIAHVPQSIFLADSSVKENIAFGIPLNQINLDEVKKAAHIACIHMDIDSWDLKYDTVVGERGVRLSGGQIQRIGLARALYKKCDVLILDEATSALDLETEQEVIKGINDMNENVTVVSIAHRLTTLNNCNLILEVKNGVVICQKNNVSN